MKILFLTLLFATCVVANIDYEMYNCIIIGELHEECPVMFGDFYIISLNKTIDQFFNYDSSEECIKDHEKLINVNEFICYYDAENNDLLTEFLYEQQLIGYDYTLLIVVIIIVVLIMVCCLAMTYQSRPNK